MVGTGALPAPLVLAPGDAGEATEGRLARTAGTITAGATRATSGDITFTVQGTDGASLRIQADASADLDAALLRKGATVTLTGIVGQRASRKGAVDGYRLWVRDVRDVIVKAAASPAPGASAAPSASPGATPLVTVVTALLREGRKVTVEGTVTVDRTLLDASGRRAIVEDGTGAIELYLPEADASIRAGVRVRATGEVGRAWGAPRLRVEAIRVIGRRAPAVRDLRVAPTAATEWRLVRVRGTIEEVRRSGDRWTAELASGGLRIPLVGLPGSGVSATQVVEGRSATITGIVKRPYPTATDQRFGVVPRGRGDVDLGAAAVSAASGATGSPRPAGAGNGSGGPGTGPTAADPTTDPTIEDVALANLGDRIGATVRVGGIVTGVDAVGVRLDDGTATARLVLEGEAATLTALLVPGDTLNATGTPEARAEVVFVVTDPAGIVLLGGLGDVAAGDDPTPSPNPLLELAGFRGRWRAPRTAGRVAGRIARCGARPRARGPRVRDPGPHGRARGRAPWVSGGEDASRDTGADRRPPCGRRRPAAG